MRLGLALGSNLGERLTLLRQATATIHAELHRAPAPFLVSGLYETAPVDCPPDSPPFLNAVLECETDLMADAILRWTQHCEQALGRPAEHDFHAPRTLDLDLLYVDEKQVSLPGLELPHPRLGERLFVLAPLAEIAPHRLLPGCPQGVAARARELAVQEGNSVRRLNETLWP